MTGSSRGRRTRGKGAIDELESGALRVRVYAGIDPMTQKRLDLIEVVPPGPKAWREAGEIRDRLVREVAEQRNPRTNATLDQLLARYLEQFSGSPNTRALYGSHIRNHISPALGHHLELLRLGAPVTLFSSAADPRSVEDLQRLLVDAVRRRGGDLEALAEYELEVRNAGDSDPIMTFVASRSTG